MVARFLLQEILEAGTKNSEGSHLAAFGTSDWNIAVGVGARWSLARQLLLHNHRPLALGWASCAVTQGLDVEL